MIVWRSLFVICIVFTLAFFFQNSGKLVVDTSLGDLSPDLELDQSTQDAMDGLTENISRNILFVVGADDKQQLDAAKADLSKRLSELKPLTVLSSDALSLTDIIDSLAKYRFHLLTATAQKNIKEESAEELAKQAQAKLFRLTNAPLMSFEKDPLGVHSEYFSEFLQKISADLEQAQTHGSEASSSDDAEQNKKHKKHYAVIQTKLQKDGLGLDGQNQLLADINTISKDLKDKYKIEILRSGVFFFAVDAASKSKKDISFISTISMVGVLLVLLLTFRSVVPLILPFLSIAFGVAFAFAVSHFIYGKIHILTIVFGASLIGIVIDYSIHYFFHQSQALSDGVSAGAERGVEHSQSRLHSALLLSLVTSLLGYLALYFSQLDALKKVAVFSCCGLTMAWLSVICLGQYSSKRIKVNNTVINTILNIFKRPLTVFSPRIVVITIVLLMLSLALSIFAVKTSDDPRFFFTPDPEILASEVAVSQIASDYEPGRFVVISGQSSEELIGLTESFYDKVKATPPLIADNFKSITQWLPTPQQQRENYQIQGKLYGDNQAVDALYSLLGAEKSKAKVIKTEYANSEKLILEPQQLNELFKEILPPLWYTKKDQVAKSPVEQGHKNSKAGDNFRNFILIAKGTDFEALEKLSNTMPFVNYVNTVESAKKSLADQRVSATQLLLVAYALIALLILSRYRKLSALNIVLVPLCATAALIVLLNVLGVSFNLFHVMALFLVLGLGMDYGIFAYELQDGNVTQQAIFISAITSLLSFGLLGLSAIPVAQSFGMILFIGNSFNLIASLIYAEFLANKAITRYK
ncbi:MMPL family transporter [uncultured Cocleimonas sp.]|uniref:MMPL family transporter n=1 Tax=uncultured Cocleimonas sp. TaxID=1051587 RepID=UPI0026262F02|nr:MMPL family transporter [uncultured Cocleimonas sp.]